MADLWEFPYVEGDETFPYKLELTETLPKQVHHFTHHKAYLYPNLYKVEQRFELEACQWVSIGKIDALPFSAGHRKIARELEKTNREIFTCCDNVFWD